MVAKFSGHRPCRSGDTTAKLSCVALQDHVIRRSGGFKEGNSDYISDKLTKLIAIDIVLINTAIIIIIICNVIIQVHMII